MLETVNLAKNVAPTSPKINDKILTKDVQLTATDVHAVASEVLRIEIHAVFFYHCRLKQYQEGWFICNVNHSIRKNTCSCTCPIPQANALIFVVNLFVV